MGSKYFPLPFSLSIPPDHCYMKNTELLSDRVREMQMCLSVLYVRTSNGDPCVCSVVIKYVVMVHEKKRRENKVG